MNLRRWVTVHSGARTKVVEKLKSIVQVVLSSVSVGGHLIGAVGSCHRHVFGCFSIHVCICCAVALCRTAQVALCELLAKEATNDQGRHRHAARQALLAVLPNLVNAAEDLARNMRPPSQQAEWQQVVYGSKGTQARHEPSLAAQETRSTPRYRTRSSLTSAQGSLSTPDVQEICAHQLADHEARLGSDDCYHICLIFGCAATSLSSDECLSLA